MRSLIFLLFLLASIISYAQAPDIQWQKCFGGDGADGAYSIIHTSDDGYMVVGYTTSNNGNVTGNHGAEDMWMVKLSNTGTIQWQKCLGGSSYERAKAAQQTVDGGYIIAGYTYSSDGDVASSHGSSDFWVVKLSSAGSVEWQRCYGGTLQDEASAIQQTNDGGYIVTGNTDSHDGDVSSDHGSTDYWVVKLSSTGNIEWEKTLGGSFADLANAIKQTIDGGYIVAGSTVSTDGDVTTVHGAEDYWIVKLTSTGTVQWQKAYGGSDGEEAYSIQQTLDGGYVVAGSAFSNDGQVVKTNRGFDLWIIKLSDTGNIQWQRSLGISGAYYGKAVQQTTDGGYVVSGYGNSNDPMTGCFDNVSNYITLKLSSSGSVQWTKCVGGYAADRATDIRQTPDGGYVIAGGSESTEISGHHGALDYYIVRLYGVAGIDTIDHSYSVIIPNPTSGEIHISGIDPAAVYVYNAIGQKIKEAIDTDHLSIAEAPAGVYIIRLFDKNGQLAYQNKLNKQ